MKLQDTHYTIAQNADTYYKTESQIADLIQKSIQECVKKGLSLKENISSIQEFEKIRDQKKSIFIKNIGGLNFEKCDLNPICTSEREYGKIVIKNIYFQTIPGFYMTANLFVPKDLKKPCPAVIMTCGHTAVGKNGPHYQRGAVDLAENGFVTLLVDPIGQGERVLSDELRENGEKVFNSAATNHMYLAQPLTVVGHSLMEVMIYELTRAVDFLYTLDYVDKTKIGLTGTSGGGTQTAFTAMIEDRITAAMPVCYITSFGDYSKSGQPQDSEQNIYDVIKQGFEHDDFISAVAPRPYRVGCANYDFFCVEGTIKSYERAKKIYALYGKEDNLSISFVDSIHALSDDMRGHLVNFFRKYFYGDKEEKFVSERNRPIPDEKDVLVTKDGWLLHEGIENLRWTQDLALSIYKEVGYSECDRSTLKDRVLKTLNYPKLFEDRPEIKFPRVITDQTQDNQRTRRLFFFTEQDVICTAILIENLNVKNDVCTIFVSANSTSEVEKNRDKIEKLLERGAVLILDTRGSGGVKLREYNYVMENKYGRFIDTTFIHNSYAHMLGTSLYAMKTFDVVRAYDLLKSYFGFKDIAFAGNDFENLYTLSASAITDCNSIAFGKMVDFEDILVNPHYQISPIRDVFGILKNYDFKLLLKVLNTEII